MKGIKIAKNEKLRNKNIWKLFVGILDKFPYLSGEKFVGFMFRWLEYFVG